MRRSLLVLCGLVVCAAPANAATPVLVRPLEALLAAPQATPPGIPAGFQLLERISVPAKTPFNKNGPRAKTQFGAGQTYYFVATGTAGLPGGRSIDAIYCFNASPPTGGCPPAAPVSFFGGMNFLWFSAGYQTYIGSDWFGGLGGGRYLKYQPSHRYVYKYTPATNFPVWRLMIGGPQITDNSGNTGAFALEVYGKPPTSDRVKYHVNVHLLDEPLLIHRRDKNGNENETPVRVRGTLNINGSGIVVADGKPGAFSGSISDGDSPTGPLHSHVVQLVPVEADMEVTATTSTLTLKTKVRSSHGLFKLCKQGDEAEVVLVDDLKDTSPEGALDSVRVRWTSGTCRTHNHRVTRARADNRKGERLRVDLLCFPTRGFARDLCTP